MAIPWQQYADEELNYLVDFGRKIVGDQIVGEPTVTASDGVTVSEIAVVPSQITGAERSAVTFLLTGGSAGVTATITCRAQTEGGLTPEAKPLLNVL